MDIRFLIGSADPPRPSSPDAVSARSSGPAAENVSDPGRNRLEQPPPNAAPTRDTTLAPTPKRQRDVAAENNPPRPKRAQLKHSGRPQIVAEEADRPRRPVSRQPSSEPRRQESSHSARDLTEESCPRSRVSSSRASVSRWLESIALEDRADRASSSRCLSSDDQDVVANPDERASEGPAAPRTEGCADTPTGESTCSRSSLASDDSAPSVSKISYRQSNLMSNGICIRHSRARLPSDVARSVEEIRADRGSPGLSARQMDEYLDGLGALAEGCTEADVEEFFRGLVFPELLDPTYGSLAGLGCADSALLPLHLVPDDPESRFVVSQPRPSLLYGFSKDPRDGAFTPAHVSIVESLHPRGASPSPAFPFLAILFKAVGGTQGDLWVATDQCAGASAACLNAVDLLNKQLRDRGSEGVGSICFSVAMDNNVAQLYVSWKEGDAKYWVQRVDDFLLSNPDHFTSLRSRVRNILDWAKRTHLEKIRRALDVLEQTGRHG